MKHQGLIIYEKEDGKINQFFIETITRHLNNQDIGLEFKNRDEVDGSEKTDFVINRSRDYLLSKEYEKRGIRVFNNSDVVLVGNDKRICQAELEDKVRMMELTDDYPAVVKSIDGHGGKQVFRVESKAEEDSLNLRDYIRQKICNEPGKDKRVYIIGNEIVAAVLRTSDDFKSNFSLGGKAVLDDVSEKEKAMVDIILQNYYIDYGGIDFIYHNGEPVFNEIEDAVGARMLYNCSEIDIIKMYAKYIAKELDEHV